ncbi:MAG: acyltransferase [Thermodesulfobacteriota bacterium]
MTSARAPQADEPRPHDAPAAPDLAAPTSTAGAQLRRIVGTFSARQMLSLWVEDWVGTLLRSIPGLTGFALRSWFYKLLFARQGGFGFIYRNVYFMHSYAIRMGRNVHIHWGAFFDGRGGLTIGDDVLIGPHVVIVTSQHHWTDPSLPIVQQGHLPAPVVIGDDVWIGANAVITPGVTVATGTVVGAGSVVTRSTEPYTIVAGVPARPIGERPKPTPR